MTREGVQRFDGPLTPWDGLPDDTRHAVEEHTGTVTEARTVLAGFNSQLVTVLETAGGHVFVKGMRSESPRAWMQANEAAINPYVTCVAPPLVWQVDAGGWHLLGFEHTAGRPADYSPGSADLTLVVGVLTRLGALSCPEIPLQAAEERWPDYCDNPDLLAGEALVHTDWNPGNVLVDGDAVHVVDWAWPTRGAGCIDPACWALWLIVADHDVADAESWAARVPAYAEAAAEQVDAYVQALCRRCAEIARNRPHPWEQAMADAAARWAEHRAIT